MMAEILGRKEGRTNGQGDSRNRIVRVDILIKTISYLRKTNTNTIISCCVAHHNNSISISRSQTISFSFGAQHVNKIVYIYNNSL